MPFARRSSPLVFALVALTLAGCKKKETPTPEPSPSAAPPIAQATAASATASASASAAPAPATDITEIRIALPQEGDVIYLQIKHPNARAADVLNRELKAAADKRASSSRAARSSPSPTRPLRARSSRRWRIALLRLRPRIPSGAPAPPATPSKKPAMTATSACA